jgi:para-aminobenzoate synthetase/4-amino-4-deoxychorismate lyase
VYDSLPQEEWEECGLKARFLTDPTPDFQLIETVLWQRDSGYWMLERHLARILRSARFFGFRTQREDLAAELAACAADLDVSPPTTEAARVRLTLSRSGQRTISTIPCPCPGGLEVLDRSPSTDQLPLAAFSDRLSDSKSPFLYHKTTRRPLYDKERERAETEGFLEILFCNESGEVTEGTITNVFSREGLTLFTPPVRCGLLDGIYRRYLLDQRARLITPGGAILKVRERVLTQEDIDRAEAVYLVNSVRGIVQVRLSDR